jgi:uncharacterized membrane protein
VFEILLVLITAGIPLFSFIAVIWLLVRVKKLGGELEELRGLTKAERNVYVPPEPAVPAVSAETTQGGADLMARLYGHIPRTTAARPDAPVDTLPGAPEPEVAPAADTVTSVPDTQAASGGTWRETAAEPSGAESGALSGAVAAFIHSGNIWAAGGVILLIAAFAMLMTYMARRGFFTLEMRIAAAALSGLLMLVAGWTLRKRRPLYFLILQGGGIGILYLTVFAAYKLTGYFPVEAALVLMSILVPAAVIIALFQNSQTLAFFGFLGGFAAPVLLPPGDSAAFLFAYYTVLSLGILALAFFRSWKWTAILGFAASFGVTLFYLASYTADNFAVTESFLAASIVIYTAQGIILLVKPHDKTNPPHDFYLEILLILGTPLLGAGAQWKVFSVIKHGYALVSVIFAVFYLVLAFVLLKRKIRVPPLLVEAYGALALFLANLVIPLELSGSLSSAIWAAEGAVVFFIGIRRGAVRVLAAGLVFHAAAALAFIAERPIAAYGPLRSAAFTGALVIAASAFVMFVLTAKAKQKLPGFFGETGYRTLLALWILAWWFCGWGAELWRISGRTWDDFAAWSFIAASGSAVFFFVLSKLPDAAVLNVASAPSLAIACCAMIGPLAKRFVLVFFEDPTTVFTHNYFKGTWLWAWIIFIVSHAVILSVSRKTGTTPETGGGLDEKIQAPWIFACVLLVLPVLTASLRYLTSSFNLAPSWTALAGIAPLLASLLVLAGLFRRIAGAGENFRLFNGTFLPWTLCGAAMLWFLVTLFMKGNPAPLPLYIPVLNPLELQEALCAAVVIFTQIKAREAGLPSIPRPGVFILADIMAFCWITAMLARCVHFWGGIPSGEVAASEAYSLCLLVFWAFWGIGHIITGHRLALRPVWIAGAVLTVTDIAKLLLLDMANTGTAVRIVSFFISGLVLLFIGWAAPLPPAEKKGAP